MIRLFSVVYLYQKNSGAQAARNTGTKLATGQYIQYLDSDDILYPNKLSEQVRFLKLNKECDGVFGDWEAGKPQEKELVVACKEEDINCPDACGTMYRKLQLFNETEYCSKKLENGILNIKRNQEIDFHLQGFTQRSPIPIINPSFVAYGGSHNFKRIG